MITAVTGATGAQGGATVRSLLAHGKAVRAIVRDRRSAPAMVLERMGAEIAEADLDVPASLGSALKGAQALFSVQLAPGADQDSERRQAQSLAEAARAAGIVQMVHSSVSNTGQFETMEGWAEHRWERNYWESKRDAEEIVRSAEFEFCTILRPAFMMDNFARPKAQWMFPDLANGEILTAVAPETSFVLIAAEDIGRLACDAILDPARFNRQSIEMAGDLLTLPQIAAILAATKGRQVRARQLEAENLVARGQHLGWVQTQEWMNVVNYPARPESLEAFGFSPTRFADWAARNVENIEVLPA